MTAAIAGAFTVLLIVTLIIWGLLNLIMPLFWPGGPSGIVSPNFFAIGGMLIALRFIVVYIKY